MVEIIYFGGVATRGIQGHCSLSGVVRSLDGPDILYPSVCLFIPDTGEDLGHHVIPLVLPNNFPTGPQLHVEEPLFTFLTVPKSLDVPKCGGNATPS